MLYSKIKYNYKNKYKNKSSFIIGLCLCSIIQGLTYSDAL